LFLRVLAYGATWFSPYFRHGFLVVFEDNEDAAHPWAESDFVAACEGFVEDDDLLVDDAEVFAGERVVDFEADVGFGEEVVEVIFEEGHEEFAFSFRDEVEFCAFEFGGVFGDGAETFDAVDLGFVHGCSFEENSYCLDIPNASLAD
jgi:hypothetical protein